MLGPFLQIMLIIVFMARALSEQAKFELANFVSFITVCCTPMLFRHDIIGSEIDTYRQSDAKLTQSSYMSSHQAIKAILAFSFAHPPSLIRPCQIEHRNFSSLITVLAVCVTEAIC